MVMRSTHAPTTSTPSTPTSSSTRDGSRGCRSARSGTASRCAGSTRRPACCRRPTRRCTRWPRAAARRSRARRSSGTAATTTSSRASTSAAGASTATTASWSAARRSVTGPYVDRDGVPMLAGGGTELLRGYNEFRGPGGGDVFTTARDWFAHHYYDATDGGAPKLSVRRDRLARRLARARRPAVRQQQVGHGGAYFEGGQPRQRRRAGQPDLRLRGRRHPARRGRGSTCQQWRPEDRGDGYVEPAQPASATRSPRSPRASTPRAPGSPNGAGSTTTARSSAGAHRRRLVADREQARRAGAEAAGCGGAGAPVQPSPGWATPASSSGSSRWATCPAARDRRPRLPEAGAGGASGTRRSASPG